MSTTELVRVAKPTDDFHQIVFTCGVSYSVYLRKAKRRNPLGGNDFVAFQKRRDGAVYPIAAPSVDWLKGYLHAHHESVIGTLPLTKEEFIDLGGDLSESQNVTYGPDLSLATYVGV